MSPRAVALFLAAGLILTTASLAVAAPITTLNTYHWREVRSPNTLGIPFDSTVNPQGVLNFGGDFTPNLSTGDPGTTVTAQQGGSPVFSVGYLNSPALPNQFIRAIPYDPALTGPWTLTVSNPNSVPTTVMVNTPAVGPATTPAFIKGFSLTGNGPSPTFNWAPSSVSHDSQTIFISDRNGPNGSARIIHIEGLPANATTYPLPSPTNGGITLQPGEDYWVNINVNDNRTDGSLLSRARTIIAFRVQTTAPNNPIFLPTVGPDGVFHFDIPGVGSQTIFIDPAVAVGYQYATGIGNPNFASVLLPSIGDGLFTLSACNGASLGSAAAGIVHSFGAGGVNCFQVGGIEITAGLDPTDPTAFITGLTFAADGEFTGTMTPLTADLAPIPEPATLLLFGTTAAGLALARWRRRQGVASNAGTAMRSSGLSESWRRLPCQDQRRSIGMSVIWSAILVVNLFLGFVTSPIAAADFDGTYAGTMKLVRDNSGKSRCPTDQPMTVTVQDGKFATSWRRQPGEVILKPDGSFKTTVAGAAIAGQVRGDSLETDFSDGTCTYRWELKRQP